MKDTIDQNKKVTRADVYRWPQKVKRYGLDLHPFLRLFVGLYENTVPWDRHSQGWNADLLNKYIRDSLLPALEPTDCSGPLEHTFGAKYYLKNVALEAALLADEHAELVALRSRASADPETVKAEVLHFFNKRKELRFREWWDLMQREYPDDPAWIYCVLKSVFDDCGRGVRRAPDRVEHRALQTMAAAVQQGKLVPGIGLVGRYVIERMRLLTGTARYLHHGWTRIPGLSIGQPTKEGVSLLAFLGRKAGWCVASETLGRNYLRNCDFFILCDRDTPVVGARIGQNTVYEAAGYRNGRQQHECDIALLLRVVFPQHKSFRSNGLGGDDESWSDRRWIEALKRFPFAWDHAPERLRCDPALKNEVYAALLRQTAIDPFWARYMPLEFSGRPELAHLEKNSWLSHFENVPVHPCSVPPVLLTDPDLVEALEKGWTTHAQTVPLYAGQIPEQIFQKDSFKRHWARGWRRELLRCTGAWEQVPGTLKAMRCVQKSRLAGWKMKLRRAVDQWSRVPDELAGLPELREAWIGGWAFALRRDTKRWNEVPEELKELPVVRDARCTGWKRALQRDAQQRSAVPADLRDSPEIRDAWIQGWVLQLHVSTRSWSSVPAEIKELAEIMDARVQGWETEIKRFQEATGRVPDELAAHPSLLPRIRAFWLSHLVKNAVSLSGVPKVLSGDPEIVGAWEAGWKSYAAANELEADEIPAQIFRLDSFRPFWVRGWEEKLLHAPLSWLRVPTELSKLAGVRAAWIQGWKSELRSSPERSKYVPPELEGAPELREGWVDGWEAQLLRAPKSWRRTPTELKRLPVLIAAMTEGWVAALRFFPEDWLYVPEEVRQQPRVREAWLAGWEDALSMFPNRCWHIPDEVLERSRLSPRLRALWLEHLANFPVDPSKVPKPLLRDPDLVSAMHAGWQVYAKSKPLQAYEIPEQILASAGFTAHWVRGWEAELMRRPFHWSEVPAALQVLPDAIEAGLKGWEVNLRNSSVSWGSLPCKVAALPRFRRLWARKSKQFLARIPRDVMAVPWFVYSEKELFAPWDAFLRQAVSEGCAQAHHALVLAWIRHASAVPVSLAEAPETVRSESRFQAAWRGFWLVQLRSSWGARFLPVLEGKGLLEPVLEGWARLSTTSQVPSVPAPPENVRVALARMACDLSERRILRHPGLEVLRWLEQHPWHFGDLPQGQRDHPFVWRSCRDGWLQHLKLFPKFAEVLPDAFSSDEKIRAVLRTNAAEREAFEAQEKANKTARRLAVLKATPGCGDEELPPELVGDKGLRKIRERYWRGVVAQHPRAFPHVPASLQHDARLLASLRRTLGPEIRANPLLWETLHESIRADECLRRVHAIATRAGEHPAAGATATKAA